MGELYLGEISLLDAMDGLAMLSSYQRSLLSLGDAPRRLRVKKAWLCAPSRAEWAAVCAVIGIDQLQFYSLSKDINVCDVAECQWMQTSQAWLPSYEPITLSFHHRL